MGKRLGDSEYTKMALELEQDYWSPATAGIEALRADLKRQRLIRVRIFIASVVACLVALFVVAAVMQDRERDRITEEHQKTQREWCLYVYVDPTSFAKCVAE